MPISATGPTEPASGKLRPLPPRRLPGAGFTLIEILVALVIVGITLAMISVNLAPDDGRLLRDEGERLAGLLEHASQESMLTGRSIAWSAQDNGYRFWQLDGDGQWVPATGDEIFRDRQFLPAMSLSDLSVNHTRVETTQRLVFAPGGVGTPFEAVLQFHDRRITLTGDAIGHVRIQGAG